MPHGRYPTGWRRRSATARSPSPRSSPRPNRTGPRSRSLRRAAAASRVAAVVQRPTSTRCRSSPPWPSSGPSSCRSTGCSATTRPARSSDACRPDLVVTDTGRPAPRGDAADRRPRRAARRRSAGRRHDARSSVDGPGRGRPPRRLLHQREHRPTQGSGPLAPGQLPAHPSRRPARAPGRDGLPVPAVPHGGVDHRPPAVAGPRRGRASSTSAGAEEIGEAVERHRATRLNCVPAVWRRILDHVVGPPGPGACPRSASPTPARRRRRPSCSRPSRAAAARRPRPGLLRLDRGRQRGLPRPRRHRRQAGQLRRAGPGVRVRRAEDGRALGRAARCSSTATSTTRPRPRRAWSTVGTAPVTWPTWTTTGYLRIVGRAPAT